jgi:hypothetical protein
MVKPIFTGKMDLEYARNRHPIWYQRLEGRSPAAEEAIPAPAMEVQPPPQAPVSESAEPAAAGEEPEKA